MKVRAWMILSKGSVNVVVYRRQKLIVTTEISKKEEKSLSGGAGAWKGAQGSKRATEILMQSSAAIIVCLYLNRECEVANYGTRVGSEVVQQQHPTLRYFVSVAAASEHLGTHLE